MTLAPFLAVADPLTVIMLKVVWFGMLAGVVSGAVIGLFFHKEEWMGGYQSFRRRLTRLGHISFFGLAFVNLGFAVTHHILPLAPPDAQWAGGAFVLGAISMPTCCFLTAWRKPFRRLFFIPVGSILTGTLLTLTSWPPAP